MITRSIKLLFKYIWPAGLEIRMYRRSTESGRQKNQTVNKNLYLFILNARAEVIAVLESKPTLKHLAWFAATILAPYSGLETGKAGRVGVQESGGDKPGSLYWGGGAVCASFLWAGGNMPSAFPVPGRGGKLPRGWRRGREVVAHAGAWWKDGGMSFCKAGGR